ncbi:glycosyltransferase [Agromyces atrinae]|uniref:Beta-1,4-mannosyltransferase n=1 Tax=Agromyces atrinae TaxID=592376 RepID=A0A4Q2M7T3_9MICO|nr:glycosyltransferase [Agromyces atrinae]NYD68527.1 beta-1,4-mannosyltransferase [Agromyces atrinae]RXZ85912.1 glycosyltransferase [Agromyces atrinae]
MTARPMEQRVSVLLALRPPDGTTRYVDQLVTDLPVDIDVDFFSWRAVFRHRYDILHLHWPEKLYRSPRRLLRLPKLALTWSALTLARRRGTRIVRTVHNVRPHETDGVLGRALARSIDRTTDLFITLNPHTPVPAGAERIVIPHADYVERFADIDRTDAVDGRILLFGHLRLYKGVAQLLEAFGAIAADDLSLRFVGKPFEASVAEQITEAETRDARISHRYGFLPDAELVDEISRASLVVLPYAQMHNSGALFVALSLGKPVLAPRSDVNESIRAEVGDAWLSLYDGPLTEGRLADAARASGALRDEPHAPFVGRDWSTIGHLHAEAYRRVAGVAPVLAGRDGG